MTESRTPPAQHGAALRRCSRARAAWAAALLLACTALASAGEGPQAAKVPTVVDASRATGATVVAGIVSFTRWPGEPASIRFCTLGHGPGVEELLGVGDLGSPQQRVPVRAVASPADARQQCDAVYVGTLSTAAAREVLLRSAGQPVLMIGEGSEFCSDGGMFCLQPASAAARFTVNLDALARSGLRVNPWVLRMARGTPATRP